jgi:hypothetical protein
MRLKVLISTGICVTLALTSTALPAHGSQKPQVVKGQFGESISANAQNITADKSGRARIVVTGRGFDETVGIYLAYCVMPKSGQAPTPCDGGVNKAGIGGASYWISSNAPPYAANLVDPFRAGGRFTKTVQVSERIGKIDCRKNTCALTVRSDHLREGDRSRDLFIPVTFKKRIK